MDEFIKMLDEHLDYVSHEIVGDSIMIHVISNRREVICPYCNAPSGKAHSTYGRSFQDLPVMGMKTQIIIDNRKMFCLNPDCSHTTFAETFDFLQPKGKKTERLLDKIADISLNTSSVAAADILRDGIVDVGKSTVCNLLKKNIPLPDKEKITKVCIDDFAFRKRYTYGTVMVDIDTHRIVDVLESREIDDVAQWLKTYPNLDIVSRDGSVSYNSAIKKANADIVQVSDRFHLVKGLTDAAKKHITRIVAANIGIPSGESHYEGKPAELGISRATVKRYQSPDFNPVNACYNTARDSKPKPYTGTIKKMPGEGHTFKEIEEAIRKDGYHGAISTIRMYATRERKLIKEAQQGTDGAIAKIERKWLVKLL